MEYQIHWTDATRDWPGAIDNPSMVMYHQGRIDEVEAYYWYMVRQIVLGLILLAVGLPQGPKEQLSIVLSHLNDFLEEYNEAYYYDDVDDDEDLSYNNNSNQSQHYIQQQQQRQAMSVYRTMTE
jgi:hypothetical protein